MSHILWFSEIGMDDLPQVGGKNASLGEMVSHLSALGVRVPGGFATTADAYREFLAHEGLDERIKTEIDRIDIDDVTALTRAGSEVREWIENQPFPAGLDRDIRDAYAKLGGHAAVRDHIVEDVSLAIAAKTAGLNLALLDGHRWLACEMYDGGRAMAAGFAKSSANFALRLESSMRSCGRFGPATDGLIVARSSLTTFV